MSAKFLDVRAIDIQSQHPKIVQVDFFDEPVRAEAYDVVHSSMVLNCVPTAAKRGEMLARTAVILRPGGLFFLMLPVRCVKASSRMSHEKLTRILRACGLRVVEHKSTPKVMFYCAEKLAKQPTTDTAVCDDAVSGEFVDDEASTGKHTNIPNASVKKSELASKKLADKARAAAAAREAFILAERLRDEKGNPEHFGITLLPEHLCGF